MKTTQQNRKPFYVMIPVTTQTIIKRRAKATKVPEWKVVAEMADHCKTSLFNTAAGAK